MGRIGIRELKQDASRILRSVREDGESFDVTYHGKVIARLVPVAETLGSVMTIDEFFEEWDELVKYDPLLPEGDYAVEAIRESRRRIE